MQSEKEARHILITIKKYYYLCSLIVEGGNTWAEQFMSDFSGRVHLTLNQFLDLENQFFSCLIQTDAPYYPLLWVFRHRTKPDLDPDGRTIIQMGLWATKRHPIPQMDSKSRAKRYRILACLLDRNHKQGRSPWTNIAKALTIAEENHSVDYQLEKEARFRSSLLENKAPKFLFQYLFRGVEFNPDQLNEYIPDSKSPALQAGLESDCETLPESEEIRLSLRQPRLRDQVRTSTQSVQIEPSAGPTA